MAKGRAGFSERLTRPEQWALLALIALVAIVAGWRYARLDWVTRPPVEEKTVSEETSETK